MLDNTDKNVKSQIAGLVAESLRSGFVVHPNIRLSEEQTRCYFSLTATTLQLHSKLLAEESRLDNVVETMGKRSDLLKIWKNLFGFHYPL